MADFHGALQCGCSRTPNRLRLTLRESGRSVLSFHNYDVQAVQSGNYLIRVRSIILLTKHRMITRCQCRRWPALPEYAIGLSVHAEREKDVPDFFFSFPSFTTGARISC